LEKSLIVALIVALLIIIILVLVVVVSSMSKKRTKVKVVKKHGIIKGKKYTIEDMVELAANRNTSKNDLTNAILKVSKEFVFPQKIKGKMPKGIKVYLNFVLLVASHKHADAKLIAFMNTTLKKANSDYSTEIDIYENEGLRQRVNRA
jgi:competence protein ComGC